MLGEQPGWVLPDMQQLKCRVTRILSVNMVWVLPKLSEETDVELKKILEKIGV